MKGDQKSKEQAGRYVGNADQESRYMSHSKNAANANIRPTLVGEGRFVQWLSGISGSSALIPGK